MNITNQLGQLTQLWCQMQFCEHGIVLSQPTNPASRYDFIAEINQKLYRIQCKTAHGLDNNRISIEISSKNWNNGVRKTYVDEIDYFYTHWNGKGYLIPIAECINNSRRKIIRLGEPSCYNSQKDGYYGTQCELHTTLQSLGANEYITIETADRTIGRNSTIHS